MNKYTGVKEKKRDKQNFIFVALLINDGDENNNSLIIIKQIMVMKEHKSEVKFSEDRFSMLI